MTVDAKILPYDDIIQQSPRSSEVRLPPGFELDSVGLWLQPPPKDDGVLPSKIYICSPLMVTAIVRDHENENFGRLLEFDDVDGNHHAWSMPMAMLAGDGAIYRAELLSRGLIIAPERGCRQHLTRYLQLCNPQDRARIVLKTGWSQGKFILSDDVIGQDSGERLIYQGAVGSHYAQQGNLKEWQEHVSACCRGNSRLTLALSAAFAGPLLELLHEESGGIHFRGSSSIGKTTALAVACSVWGGPESMQRWRATVNGLEGVAVAHNDTLLCLDEIGEIDPADVGAAAYMLANGSGKARSDKHGAVRKRAQWNVIFLSSGECSVSEHIVKSGQRVQAGQELRVISVPADTGKFGAFEELHGIPDGCSFSKNVWAQAAVFYGSASREFLHKLIADTEWAKEEVKSLRSIWEHKYSAHRLSGQAKRVFNRFTLVAAAGELATMYGVTGWELGEAIEGVMICFEAWLETYGEGLSHEEKTALSQVRKFFEQHGDSRFSSHSEPIQEDGRKTLNRAGFKTVESGAVEYFVLPEVFRTEVCVGLDHTLVAKACRNKGWLIPSADGKLTRSERIPAIDPERTTRCYRFNSKVYEG